MRGLNCCICLYVYVDSACALLSSALEHTEVIEVATSIRHPWVPTIIPGQLGPKTECKMCLHVQ